MMNKYFLLFLLLSFALSGCSGSGEPAKPANTATTTASNPAGASGTVGPNEGLNPPSSGPAVNGQSGDLALGSNKRKVTDVPDSGRPVLQYQQIGEDSQIASAMNAAGQMYENRIWRKHPQLLKVESVWVDQNNRALTIVLRNRKVFNITTDRLPNLKLATADQILRLAGVDPTAGTPNLKSGPKKTE